jgi:hypothetical protein
MAAHCIRGESHVTEDADEFALQREMGCTREEFVRWLPGATRHAPMQMNADKAVVHAGEAMVEISFTQAPPRRIALVSMPVLKVSFRFSGAGASAYREFMAYFDLYTKRGGG